MAWAWDETGGGRVRCDHDNKNNRIGLVEAALSSCHALSTKNQSPWITQRIDQRIDDGELVITRQQHNT